MDKTMTTSISIGNSETGDQQGKGVHWVDHRRNRGANTPAETAGASSLARYLCDPPPVRPDGKKQKGGTGNPRVSLQIMRWVVVRILDRYGLMWIEWFNSVC